MPLGELDRYATWPYKKDQFPGMEVHDVTARLVAVLLHRLDCRRDVIDREAYVIEAHLM
jgi:hypothetical protein